MDKLGQIEKSILDAIRETHPHNKIRFAIDPDAFDIINVEIFDIPDSEYGEVAEEIWDVIDDCYNGDEFTFIPSVFSHSKTVEFYSEYCIKPEKVDYSA
jgi:hypothetical protein